MNGVLVIYDEKGWPWVRLTKDLRNNNNRFWLTMHDEPGYELYHGSEKIIFGAATYVPHSSDKGRFLNKILPNLLKN